MVNPTGRNQPKKLPSPQLPATACLCAAKWFSASLWPVSGLMLLIKRWPFRKLPRCTPHHPLITSVTVAKIKYAGHSPKSGKMHFIHASLDRLTGRNAGTEDGSGHYHYAYVSWMKQGYCTQVNEGLFAQYFGVYADKWWHKIIVFSHWWCTTT